MSLSRTTKKRLLIVLCCGLLLVGAAGGAYVVRKQRVRAEYAGYRTEGLAAAKSADNEKAVDLLGKYLRRYPEDTDVLVEYVRVRPLVKSPDRAHLRDTMLVLRHLLTLHPEMAEQRRALLRMYADFGYASEAVVTADKLLEATPDDAEILGIKATSLARMRRSGEALAAAEKWAAKAPQDVDAHILCVQLMQVNGRSKGDIDKRVGESKDKLKDPASFDLVSGIAAAVTGAPDKAYEAIKRVAAQPKLDPKLTRRVIAAFDSLGKHRESLEMLQRLVKETGDASAQRGLVRRLWELNQWNDVLAYPIPAGSELASDLELKGMIGTALARTGKTAEAQAIANELTAAKQDPVAVAWGEVLGQSIKSSKDEARKLVDACQAGLKDSPNNAYLWYFQGQGYARLGEAELAVANYTKAAQLNGTWASPVASLAEALMGLGRHEQALDAATAAAQRSPAAGAVMYAIALNANVESGRLKNEEGRLASVLTDIEKAGAAQYVLPERVASLARTGKKAEAADAIKKALATTPPPSEAILPRLAMMSRLHNLGLEAECYAALERGATGAVSASVAMSKALATYLAGNKDEALAQFDKARREAGKGDATEWQIAGARLLDLARDPKAAATWVALGDGRPDDLSVQEAVLSASATRSDREFVDRTIERVKKLTGGEGVQWRIARARWTLDGAAGRTPAEQHKAGEDASVILTEVLRAAPDAIDARFLQVKALEYQENLSAAVEQMTMVVQQNPSLPASSLYLAKLLQSRGDFAKAHEYVTRATQAGLKDESSRRIAAQLLAQQGRPGEATKLLEDLGGEQGGADLLLATLYRQQGDLKRAEQVLSQLMQKPDEGVVAFAVDLYGAMGRPDDAKKAIGLLKGMKARPGTEELLLAEFSGRYGKADEAVSYSRAATQAAPKNPVTWRALVISALAAGKHDDAFAAVAQGLKELPADPYLKAVADSKASIMKGVSDPGLRPLAFALARNPEAPGTKDALELMATPISPQNPKDTQLGRLKQIADRNTLNLPLQLFAAERFLGSADRLDEAATIATRAVQSFPLSVDASRLAANALLNAKRWPETVVFAKAWHDRTPANPAEADFVAAIALMKSKQPAEAKALLAPYIPKALEQPDQGAALIALYAAALYNTGGGPEAERILVPALKSSEAVRSAWLARATEDLPVNEAVNWVGRVAQLTGDGSLSAQVQIAAASTAIGQKAGNDQLLETARQVRAKVAARTDLNPQALAVLASQAEQDRDLATAESLYRRALKLDGSLAVLKNNLAMVLANKGRKEDLAEATILATDAVRTNPSVANFYDTLAVVQAKAGQTDQAVATLRKAAAIDPGHLDWQVNLINVLLDGHKTAEARKALSDLDAAAGKRRTISDETKAKIAAVRQKVQTASGSSTTSGAN
jgi:tetratricopeptide (TPR) repeat protein